METERPSSSVYRCSVGVEDIALHCVVSLLLFFRKSKINLFLYGLELAFCVEYDLFTLPGTEVTRCCHHHVCVCCCCCYLFFSGVVYRW